MVSAPVDYAASDFVLHLFAAFCRSVIQRFDTVVSSQPGSNSAVDLLYSFISGVEQSFRGLRSYVILCVVPAAVFLHWQSPIADLLRIPGAWIYYAGIAVVVLGNLWLARTPGLVDRRARAAALDHYARDNGKALAAVARRHLADVRFLQTSTSGWSGTLAFPGGAGGQYSRAIAQAEQPLSYPEIVAEFRAFARDVAAELHRRTPLPFGSSRHRRPTHRLARSALPGLMVMGVNRLPTSAMRESRPSPPPWSPKFRRRHRFGFMPPDREDAKASWVWWPCDGGGARAEGRAP
jgi:hypothetical protein